MPRKGRTGLEWLLDEPPKAGGNGSAGAAVAPSEPSVPEPKPDAELDAALALLDPGKPTGNQTVSSPAPAALALTLGVAPAAEPAREPTKRGLDAVANALNLAEKAAKQAAKATDEATDAVADSIIAGPGKPEGEPSVTEMREAIALAEEAVRVAAKAVDDGADHIADQIVERHKEKEPGPEVDGVAKFEPDNEPSTERSVEVSVAEGAPIPADEPVKAAPAAEPSVAMAAHTKAVSTGRSTRSHPRVAATFEVKFRKGSESTVGNGRNVSRGGFFVESKKLLAEGEVFQAQLVFTQSGNRKLSVIAEVMWSTTGDAENLDRFPPGMGCKFLDVDERDTPFLKELIEAALAAGPPV